MLDGRGRPRRRPVQSAGARRRRQGTSARATRQSKVGRSDDRPTRAYFLDAEGEGLGALEAPDVGAAVPPGAAVTWGAGVAGAV